MKTLRIGAALAFSLALFASCKKDSSSTPPPGGSTGLVRIVQGTDPDLTNDTVYNISYNQSGKINILVDSINNHDTLVATYDGNGNLTAVTDKGDYPIDATFTYDGSNHLTQIDYVLYGVAERYVFEYTNGVVSKKSYYTDQGSGLALWQYFTYTVTSGNITSIDIYQKNGAKLGTMNVTYGTQTNPFANLCLFNYGGRLGLDNLAPLETYFNKNVPTAFTVSGFPATTVDITFDNKQQITKAVANDQYDDYFSTWQFYYK
jgi:YD repeat-containing protein